MDSISPSRAGQFHVLPYRDIATTLFEAAVETDRAGAISEATWTLLRESGLLIAPFPAAFGGQSLAGPDQYLLLSDILRSFGAADLSVTRLYEGHVNAIALVCRYGTPAQIASLARDVKAGHLTGVWAAEDSVGLHGQRTNDGVLLTGRKIYASGAGFVTRPLVTMSLDDGQRLAIVNLQPDERADLSGWTPLGMRATATGTVDFSGIVVPANEIIGGPSDFSKQPWLSGGAWRFCAAQLGAAERLVDLFRAELVARKRSDDPFQLQRVAQAAVAATTARFWVEDAARRLACHDDDAEDIVAFTNLTRMVTERSALDIMEIVQRGVGLSTFMRPHPIERICRDLSTYLRQPVPDMAMRDGAQRLITNSIPIGDVW